MKKHIIALSVAGLFLAGCSPTVETASEEFNRLPTEVQKTVRAQAPNAEIADVNTKEMDGQTVYEIRFTAEGKNPTMVVTRDGRVLQSDWAQGAPGMLERVFTGPGAVGTELSALPKKVQDTIQEHAPNAPIANISRSEDNGLVIYTVEFQDKGANPTLRVAENGTLIEK